MKADRPLSAVGKEFALRLKGQACTALKALPPNEVVNAFLAVAVGLALELMARESVAGWLHACAEHVTENGDGAPPPPPTH